jgi:uncharacterized OsmC-like protein
VKHVWSVRVRAESRHASHVHARNHAFRVGPPLSFEPKDEIPSALEHLLGALAADLLGTLFLYARRRRIPVDAAELVLNAALENPLVHLGVVGEEGSPALEEVSGTLYASIDASADDAEALWEETLRRAPVYQTLARAARIEIRFRVAL